MIPKRFRKASKGLRALLTDKCLINIVVVISIGAVLMLFYSKYIGAMDRLLEVSFRHFRWEPYLNVRRLVDQEMVSPTSINFPHYHKWSDYTPLVTPTCNGNLLTSPRQSLLIIVKSAPGRAAYRSAIRNTWGAIDRMEGFNVRTVFVMGLEEKGSGVPRPNLMSEAIREESFQYGDLLIGNFTDSYDNNTYKWIHSIWLARHYCDVAPSYANANSTVPSYLFLVDDDYLLSLRNLVREAKRHSPADRLYMGWRFAAAKPHRRLFRKHRVTLREYPFTRYPPFITAGAVLLTAKTVKEFYLGIQYVKAFMFDDVYAGIIAHLLRIPSVHSSSFAYFRPPPSASERAHFWRGAIASHTVSAAGEVEKSYEQFIAFANADGISATASEQSLPFSTHRGLRNSEEAVLRPTGRLNTL